METTLETLLAKAFGRAQASEANLAIHRAREAEGAQVRSFEAVIARDAPVAAVHEYRKALRRGRALVQLSRPLLGEEIYREIVKELRVAFLGTSPMRDATVLLETLNRLEDQKRTRSARRALRRTRRSPAGSRSSSCRPWSTTWSRWASVHPGTRGSSCRSSWAQTSTSCEPGR